MLLLWHKHLDDATPDVSNFMVVGRDGVLESVECLCFMQVTEIRKKLFFSKGNVLQALSLKI